MKTALVETKFVEKMWIYITQILSLWAFIRKDEWKVLQYFGNGKHNLAEADTFAEVVKVTNQTGLWDALSSPDTLQVLHTGFAEVDKVTNYIRLWDALSSPRQICRGHQGDKPHWTVRWPELTRYFPTDIRSISLPGLEPDLRIHGFRPGLAWSVRKLQIERNLFNHLLSVINGALTFHTTNVFGYFRKVMVRFELVNHKLPN